MWRTRRSTTALVSSLAAVVLAGCTRGAPPAGVGHTSDPPASEDSPSESKRASESNAEHAPAPANDSDDARAGDSIELEVPDFGPALVVLPNAASRPAPLLVAAHGAGDSPEWQCEHWGGVARGRYFVLCPRGLSLGRGSDGYYFANHFTLERELVAALAAMRRKYGPMVRLGGGVYTGYSQGATMGALMVVEHGTELSHLVLVEGGWGEWTLGRAKRFAATGGKSVALVCGGTGCMKRAEAAAKVLARAGLRARAELVEGGGHTYVGVVGERATELFENWLFSDER